jgi:hypothetical protein
MVDPGNPAYRFVFRGGLSTSGVVERISATIDRGQAHRVRYRLDDLPLVAPSGRSMPTFVADMLDVSAAVYIADRLALREVDGDPRFPGDRWHRRIHVVLPVRHPACWRRPAVMTCLEELLAFLTDDLWSFAFTKRSSAPRPAEAQVPLLQAADRQVAVALHSGGLDSLCGLTDLITNGQEEAIVPVTVVTNARVRSAAKSVIDEIRQSGVAAPELRPTRLHIGISGIGRPRDDREPTQRARAMLFITSGIGAAVIAGTDLLRVCENGVGALNVPMTADHWGARATRAMHPKTLHLLSRLSSLVLDRPIAIENLALFTTKGELARGLGRGPFAAAARHTISCDRATYMNDSEACGTCTSCILRRVALVAADLDEVVDGQATRYRTDWFVAAAAWSSENITHLVAMRDQVERLRDATRDDGGFAALDRAFPGLFDVVNLAPTLGVTEGEVEQRLLRLYGTYVREFDAFMARIDRPGWGRGANVTELGSPAETAAVG